MTTPILALPDWAAAQETPWVTMNKIHRMVEALARRGAIEDRDASAPPGSCADGACYLIAATGSGAWVGETGKLAIAVGLNASNGWYFVTVATEGTRLWVRDEDIEIRYTGAAWVQVAESVNTLNDLTDVEVAAIQDGDQLYYDLSGGLWYNAPPIAAYYKVGFFFAATPAASEVLFIHVFTDAVNFADDFAGQFWSDIGTNSTADYALDIQKNNSSVGTITIHPGGSVSIVTTGGTLSFARGDRMKIIGNNTPDATAANFAGSFKGTM